MKFIIFRLALVLATFTVVPDAVAADTAGGNVFLDAKLGTTFGKVVSNDSAYTSGSQASWGVDGGYRWNLDDAYSVGVDVGYMNFGQIAHEFSTFGGGSDVSASAISLGGHMRFLLGDAKAWYVQAGIGLMSLKSDTSGLTAGSDSSRQGGVYFGLGVGRNITQSFSLALVYDRYSANDTRGQTGGPGLNLNWIGLEGEYRF
jgi:outer membrane protein assembly factor BamA